MGLLPTFASEEEKETVSEPAGATGPPLCLELEFSRFRKPIFSPPSVSVIHLAIVGLGGSHIDPRVAAVSCLSVVILEVISPITLRVFSSPSSAIPQDNPRCYCRSSWFKNQCRRIQHLLSLRQRFNGNFPYDIRATSSLQEPLSTIASNS
ncbi:hypothetical protein GALMADRAFT_143279 [Galerina marginata CBS 339.88]|uniref:Uncharacterized protein n=1 Tax=Galerina marginata (strain CBS 339.88) TaxID=685588 RepID=A0A067T0E0_GALM3|nr:hypothetical protein GALMADRAFT_143279 [Galerina marginata CBS 339.88]